MLLDVTNSSGAWVRGEHLDKVTASLRALADAALRAEGAFARLAAQAASPQTLAETGGSFQGLVDDLTREMDLAGDRMADGILRSNARAVARSLEVWDRFGDRMASLFGDLFDQIARDGEISVSSLFRSILPMVGTLIRQLGGVLGGVAGTGGFDIAGLLGGGTRGGLDIGSLLGAGSSIFGMVTGGGPLGGVFGSGLGALGAASPYIAGALTLAQILGPTLFAPSPSVGPTTVARVTPATGEAVYSTDNDGDPAALVDTIDAIFHGIERVQSRFGGLLNGNGFDIGYFPSPEDGSGQTGGYNFKAIVAGRMEDEDRFRGLSEPELIAEAVKFIVREGLEGIDVPEVAEAARHSVADSLEDLFDDLIFAERFGVLRDALAEAGDGVDAYTVALQRQRLASQEAGRTLATDGVQAIRDFLDRAMTLFPGETDPGSAGAGGAIADTSGIGTALPGEDRTVLYEQDEGTGRFQPGVTGLYDDLEGYLTGLEVAGRALTFVGGERTDEGRPYGDQNLPDGMIEIVGGVVTIANDALSDLASTASDLGQAVDRTTERSQAYLDNQQRVRDAFAIAAADVDALIATIAGGLEPETIGPFEDRLLAGTAAIGQLQSELHRINQDIAEATEVFPDLGVAVIDVAAKVAEATDLLTNQLRSNYTDQVSRDLRDESGLGAADDVTALVGEYRDRLADGEAIGITDFSDLETLYRERILSLLEDSDDLAGVLDQLGAAFSDLQQSGALLPEVLADLGRSFSEEIDRNARAAAGIGIVDDISDRLAEYEDQQSIGESLVLADLSGLDTILRDQLADLFTADALDLDAIEAIRVAFAGNTLVLEALADALENTLAAANDNATAQFSVADATRLATRELARQIEEQERLATTAERVIEGISDTRRRIALDANLSILSPEQQLDEARSFFESLAARAAEGDQEAQLDLGGAAQDYLQLARDFYASNEDYARIFAAVDGALGDTQSVAERQLSVAQAQLEELRTIARGFSGDLGGLPNPNANFGNAPTRNRIIAQLTGYAGDFGAGQFGAFRAGLSPEINRIVDLLDQTIPFAQGGIMTESGPLPLARYAAGGVADSPQLALFGEGRLPEAFVPLPDGRSIPVTIAQPANDRPASPGHDEGLADLITETRRMTSALTAMRADNAALRRGLERVVAASRGPGRAA
ncbi:hypothetical protein T8K17_08955 [Thalassobaculum sp. OXR-137]|uniref:hypothetical protein n=1 Tax=Thalassobaculum sp. OXR-137 TaxID=3100173 RepID=UPI002AC9801A|nr:hypothetical protein [Thalassobaculum sp. OXR-137]WPZ36265.1 hypothetical protein T8K17_08955 [Thalassobaculum sp. OXR-137]